MNRALTATAAAFVAFAAFPALAQVTPYAGVQLGYDRARFEGQNAAGTTLVDVNGQGFVGGMFGGIWYALGPRLSLGGEFEVNLSQVKGGALVGGGLGLDHEVSLPMAATVNIAYAWNNRFTLLFGGGFARARIESTLFDADDEIGAVTKSTSGTTLNFGIQHALGRRLFVRGQYVMTRYGAVEFLEDDDGTIKTSSRLVRLGIGTTF